MARFAPHWHQAQPLQTNAGQNYLRDEFVA
jgi:hypothetical protein